MGQKIRISHNTSAHPRYDTRIFFKQCRSLSSAGYEVSLVVADGRGDEVKEGVRIYDVGKSSGRLDRFFHTTHRVYLKAKALNSDIYHFHDPELIPFGLKLKKLGKKVIFDFHEDAPMQMLSKPYLTKPARWVIAQALRAYENYTCRRFDGIIAATPFIRNKFFVINKNTININNFPLCDELATDTEWTAKNKEVCYIGGIAKIRGIFALVQAMGFVEQDIRLNLCGNFDEQSIKQTAEKMIGWRNVIEHGFIDRKRVREILARSVAGIVTLMPIKNYLDSLPIKMFEYMSAGLPVIASDFPLWREIIEGNRCGICVDPLDPKAIAEAINYIIVHPDEAEQMGRNGRQAVFEKYNWNMEEKKLLALYEELTKLRVSKL